jgi:SAM-dependent methyltransferase
MNPALRSYERHIAPFARPFAESTVRWAATATPLANVILDHGAGSGLVTRLLLRGQPALRVVALDPNASLLSALMDEHRCQCVVGTAGDLAPDGPSFDLVVSNLVLPFCPDAAGDLARIRARTSPTGKLVVTTLGRVEHVTPFHRFWSAAGAVIPDAWEPTRYPHHRFGASDVFIAEVESGGWTVQSVHPVRAVRRISGARAWTWLSSVLPVGVGDAYRPLSDLERHAVRSAFLRDWASETRWVSNGWTVVASR